MDKTEISIVVRRGNFHLRERDRHRARRMDRQKEGRGREKNDEERESEILHTVSVQASLSLHHLF